MPDLALIEAVLDVLLASVRLTLIFWTVNVGMSLTTGYVPTLSCMAAIIEEDIRKSINKLLVDEFAP